MNFTFVSWDQIEAMVDDIVSRMDGTFDALLAITRGGMIPACLISQKMGLRNIIMAAVVLYTSVDESRVEPTFLQFPPSNYIRGKRVLVVDDVWDTGRTVTAVRQRVIEAGGIPFVAVLHHKPGRSLFPGDGPDVCACKTNDWIVYPWDPQKAELRLRAAMSPQTTDSV